MIEDLPNFETQNIASLQNNMPMIHPATYFKQFLNLIEFMNSKFAVLSLFLFIAINGFSQTADPVKDTAQSVSSLTLSLIYSTNTVFVGRKDANYKGYLNPSLTYMNKTGLFVSLSGDYYPELKTNKFVDYSYEGGYQFTLASELTGSVYVSRMHSNSNSTKVNAGVGTSFGTYLSWDNDIINFGTGFDYSKGKFNDVTLTPTISKDITFSFGDILQYDLSIDPTLTFSFGSQNFYRYYLIDRKYVNPTVISRINGHISEMKKFQLLDYEFSVPVSLSYNSFTFTATPFYVIPVNQPDFKNILPLLPGFKYSDNTFFFQFGLSYQF